MQILFVVGRRAPEFLSKLGGLAAAFGISVLINFAGTTVSLAECFPQAANNVTATCTGATINQDNGAPNTSLGANGYGSGNESNVIVNVLPGSGNSITGSSAGVYLSDGRVLIGTDASITGGGFGVATSVGDISVINSGSVIGTAIYAITTNANATVVNNAGSTIQGANAGVYAPTGTVDLTNYGTITGTGLVAIYSGIGGSSVFNSGTITGGPGGAISLTGSNNTVTITPTAVIQGAVDASNGVGSNNTFQLGGAGAATFDISQISPSGQYRGFNTVNKIGASFWGLFGTSTFTGPLNVNGGTLNVDGNVTSVSTLTVNSGGWLGGGGTVGNTAINDGTFEPGFPGSANSSMTVAGTLSFSSGATYLIFLTPSTASFASVSGAATLGGATVSAIFASGSYIPKQYTILTYGSRVGSFGALTTSNLPANFSASLSYNATKAFLDLALNLPTAPSGPNAPSFGGGLSVNQTNVGNALVSYFNTTGGIPAVYGTLTANGLSQASGQPGVSFAQVGINATDQFINTVFDNALDQRRVSVPLGFAATNDTDKLSGYAAKPKSNVAREASDAFALAMPVKALNSSFASRWSVWGAAYGGNSRVSGDAVVGSATTTSRAFGVVAGANYLVSPSTQVGFALGGAGTSFSLDNALGGGKADVFNLAAFAKHNIGAAYLAAALGYSWQNTSTDRTVTIGGTDRLHASFNTQALAARVEGGWRYATPLIGITPYAGLQTTTLYLPTYGESAISGSNAFALSYASKTVTATRGELGTKFDNVMLAQGGVFTLKAKTAWAHDWNTDRNATATFQALPGATFTVNGATQSANAALVSLGGEMKWPNGWAVAANFDGEFSRTTAGYSGKGSLRYAW